MNVQGADEAVSVKDPNVADSQGWQSLPWIRLRELPMPSDGLPVEANSVCKNKQSQLCASGCLQPETAPL